MSGSDGSFQNSTGFRTGDSGDVVDNDRSHDPASSGLFGIDFKRHDDLKEALDSSDEKKKLEAMKRIVGMVAKGKDASPLFPAVVKNVACKNLEVKKLVYVYLTRYAEEQQDLALLSIATFQRAMKDPNQLIRASALRVLSSIRVPVIVPIMMLVIKDGVSDMSPYVRKAAAHAIPKLYSVDPDQKEELIQMLEKLLSDKTTLVIGSAIQAFEELCPERIDLIHKNYRRFCSLLVDVEEWGQVILINMLTRYARTQFVDPNKHDEESTDPTAPVKEKAFYSSDEESDSSEDGTPKKPVYIMDQDHRLLLRSAKPLLNSRNSAVVMAVAQLYYHCAPKSEVGLVARAMIRLLRSPREIQYLILNNIATMALNKKGMFEPYIKSFYVRANDPIHVKLLKLDILTSLATDSNVSVMMREFQQYVLSAEKDFAAATIQAIGKIASAIADISDACLGGLIQLLSNKSEVVVGESVIVIKKLLQMKSSGHKDIISHLAQMVDRITVSNAKGSILWLIGEYCDKVPKIAPDVLRKAAKAFVQEDDIVKLQTLNLAAKLSISNAKQAQLLCQYVFNLAKYDQSYDIRDRVRFLRALILPGENAGALAKHAKKIFLADKPAPVLESRFKERDHYQLGSLSYTINSKAHGYFELADWPEVAPPSSVRNVEPPPSTTSVSSKDKTGKAKKERGFYSDSSEEEEEESDEDEDSEEEESEEETEEEDSEEEEEDSDEEYSDDNEDTKAKNSKQSRKQAAAHSTEEDESEEEESEEETDSSEEEEDSSEEDSDDDITATAKKPPAAAATPKSVGKSAKDSQLLLDLLDFDQPPPSGGGQTASGSMLTPMAATTEQMSGLNLNSSGVKHLQAEYVTTESHELLNRMNCDGLSATYRFTRTSHMNNPKMVSVEVVFHNQSDHPITGIKVGEKRLQNDMHMHEFSCIKELAVGAITSVTLGIDFNDTLQPAEFNLDTSNRSYKVKVEAIVGELLAPVTMSQNEFNTKRGKLGGMNETSSNVNLSSVSLDDLHQLIVKTANVGRVPPSEDNCLQYAALTLSHKCDLLVKIKKSEARGEISINCEKIVFASMFIKDVKLAIASL